MQYSNGITNPAGLWLGHLMFDGISGLVVATVCAIVFATVTNQFHGVGYVVCVPFLNCSHRTALKWYPQWFIIFLYGVCGALFAYAVTLFTPSPLAAFATVAGYQILMFVVCVYWS